MRPEREPMENDSNSRTAEELEQQTVDVYVERALHGPVFRMSYEHTHTYCEIFYLKSGTCTYTVNQGQWHLEAGDLFIVAAGDPHSTRYEGKTSCERIIVFCKADVLAGMMRGDPTEVQQALERSCKVILNAETRTMVEALFGPDAAGKRPAAQIFGAGAGAGITASGAAFAAEWHFQP